MDTTGQYRTQHSFNLSGNIPSNATITSAKIEYNLWDWSVTNFFVICKLQTNYAFQQLWDAIGSSPLLFSYLSYNGGTTSSTQVLIDAVNAARSGNLYLGTASLAESSSDVSYAKVDLTLKITYTVPPTAVNITAKNNFEFGTIKVGVDASATQRNSPFPITPNTGQTINLEAQNQAYGGYDRVWNNFMPNNTSKWQKQIQSDPPADLLNGQNINYSFSASTGDNNSFYIAGLRKNYLINQNNQTEFNGTILGSSSYIVEQNSGQISTQGNGYTPGTITYNFAGWTDNSTMSTTRTITPTDNQTYTALYKYLNHANTNTAYSSNSQKKLVRDTNGWLHKVYASMNMIWYERSTNNGATWTLQNNGKPLSSNNAKLPAIDFYGTSYIFITWQEEYGETFKIRLAYMSFPEAQLVFQDVWDPTIWADYTPYSYDATPIISWGAGNVLIVAWKFGGIMYRYGYCSNYSPITWYTSEYGEWISNTNENSANPTIAIRKDNGTSVFHLAWQQSTTAIKYRSLTPNVSSLTISAEETPSSGDNVNYKRNPSISVITTQPTLVWVGANYDGAIRKVYKRTRGTSSWGSFSIYGNEIESPTEYNGIIVWSEPNWVNKMFRWGSIKTLPTIGKYIQASNGPSANSMYAVVHRNVSPFEFQTTQSLGSLPKIIISNSGREGIISKGNAEFGFVIADVACNGDVVAFENVNDTTVIANIGDLNNYLSTTAFTPNEGSDLGFSIAYGTNDSLEATNALNDGSNISFTLELVDANTNEIISTLDSFVFDENNICSYGEQSYNINMQGIGNRNVKLRITSNTSFNGSYNLANIYAESNILGKNNSRELSINGGSVITTYDLYQNYPNPFNPGTTIKFQIPKDGIVTLKVYDILGNEVSTLINEQKTQGRYEINFNASILASGVYIYKIQAGEFVSSKKMILLR